MLRKIFEILWPPRYIIEYKAQLNTEAYNRLEAQIEAAGLKGTVMLLEECKLTKV